MKAAMIALAVPLAQLLPLASLCALLGGGEQAIRERGLAATAFTLAPATQSPIHTRTVDLFASAGSGLHAHERNHADDSSENGDDDDMATNRRNFLSQSILLSSSPFLLQQPANAAAPQDNGSTTTTNNNNKQGNAFESLGYTKREYTNSITASRDTNISPFEVYDTIASRLAVNSTDTNKRALDVGAGAGVSTQVIYDQLGYQTIDAVDWSGDAWYSNVVQCPDSVNFYEMDDERFVKSVWQKQLQQPKYDMVVFNFAINADKAKYFCQNLLKDESALLLAPINVQKDYWLRQTYYLLDRDCKILWSANDVGAWSVLFQPDVTQDTCQGIWCAPYNGFKKMK